MTALMISCANILCKAGEKSHGSIDFEKLNKKIQEKAGKRVFILYTPPHEKEGAKTDEWNDSEQYLHV